MLSCWAGQLNVVFISVIICAMKCPVCSNRLRSVKSKSEIVDVCPGCRGIWFDSGKFIAFVNELAKSEEIAPEDTKFFQPRKVHTVYEVKERSRSCPKCNTKLQKFNYCGDSNVFLDRCSSCGGIWADAGEAEQVAGYIKEDPGATAVAKGLAETGDIIKAEKEIAREAGKAYLQFYLPFIPRVVVPLGCDAPRERFPVVTIVLVLFSVLFFASRIFYEPGNALQILTSTDAADLRSVDLLGSMFLVGSLMHLIWDLFFL